MAIFKAKNYASIVAPLKKMVNDLKTYVGSKSDEILNLNNQRDQIDKDIGVCQSEIKKSNFSIDKINELISVDLDDGVVDVDQLPKDEEVESD
ncbi:MAG: hypothetical protein ACFFG0_00385 [Candidatus Thorarchaeota archaeon]